ncbi:MAG TPA: hypothetical protein VGR49_06830 [Actinomycetota bacterium]|nr:hypothetical protein [Actinomycetota bacterium]
MGERASNLFGVLLSLTFFSVLLAVMLVAVSILPDSPGLAPPTLPGETESGPVRTPQPVTLGELALEEAPALAPPGAALASVTFATAAISPATGTEEPGGPSVGGPGPGGPSAGPGGGGDGVIRRPGRATPDTPGKARGLVKKKGESGHPKRGHGFLRCEDESHAGKGRAKGRCDRLGDGSGNGNGGGGRGKGRSFGGALDAGGSGSGGSSHGGNGLGLGHAKGNGKGHGNGRGKGHSKFD